MTDTPHPAHKLGISLIERIESQGFTARFAGGSVRDRLLGHIPHDYDIATDATPDQICSIFTQKTHKVIPTGLEHGTVTVVYRTIPFEITTLRKDVATDGRHAVVEFGGSFEDDALRRDFTVNAMYEDAEGRIYDYFGGQDDLKDGLLRFVGDPAQRIQEDYLRILRYFRFWGRLGFRPDPAAIAAIDTHKEGLQQISVERITTELIKLLQTGSGADAPLKSMLDTGVLPLILGQDSPIATQRLSRALETRADFYGSHADQLQEKTHILDLAAILAAASPHDLDALLKNRLRLSNPVSRLIQFAQDLPNQLAQAQGQAHGTRAELMATLDACDKAAGEDRSFLPLFYPFYRGRMTKAQRNILNQLAQVERDHGDLRLAKLPISGKDLSRVGIPMGPVCGEILAALKESFRNGEWRSKDEGLDRAQRLFTALKDKQED